MSGILVIERSASLTNLLKRTLDATRMQARAGLSSYAEAIKHLQDARGNDDGYSVLLLGAPPRPTREFAGLLEYLRQAEADLPVVLIAHEPNGDWLQFIAGRPNGRLLLWTDFSRLPGIVHDLLPAGEIEAMAAVREYAANVIRILLVDDSSSIRSLYQHMFERAGYAVVSAESIAHGKQAADAGNFDIGIIDYFLPDGNGEELCRYLREKPQPPLLAVLTGAYREEIVKHCIEAGASECLFKNEAPELTLARVSTLARYVQARK